MPEVRDDGCFRLSAAFAGAPECGDDSECDANGGSTGFGHGDYIELAALDQFARDAVVGLQFAR